MRADAIVFGIAGSLFGLIIGSQQASLRAPVAAPSQAAAAPSSNQPATRAAVIDEAQVNALKSIAEREPANPKPRVTLANLYFDAERYDDAIKWYADALKLKPNDVDVSTDLGVSYYYTNQADKALAQFDHSLKLDPKHAKTLLNVGIVRAFGKQDLDGATQAWQQVIKIAPDSPEGQAAKRALDTLKQAHGQTGGGKPGA